jgi:hypothetical protein
MIYKLMAEFRATGSVHGNKKTKKRPFLTEEKFDAIVARSRCQSGKVTAPISALLRGVKIGCKRSNRTA